MIVHHHISPEPPPEDREAILKAVRLLLEREASRTRPQLWAVHGRTQRRTGVTDLARSLPEASRWRLSARLPRGGREYPGLTGRGDAK